MTRSEVSSGAPFYKRANSPPHGCIVQPTNLQPPGFCFITAKVSTTRVYERTAADARILLCLLSLELDGIFRIRVIENGTRMQLLATEFRFVGGIHNQYYKQHSLQQLNYVESC